MTASHNHDSARSGRSATFFLDGHDEIQIGGSVDLGAGEVSHARALRIRSGDRARLTDGRGRSCEVAVRRLERRGLTLEIIRRCPPIWPPPFVVWAPTGNRERNLWLAEKATEIGVGGLRYIEFDRSRSVADAGRSDGFLGKVRRRTISALKQSGGDVLPGLLGPTTLDEALSSLEARGGRAELDAVSRAPAEAVSPHTVSSGPGDTEADPARWIASETGAPAYTCGASTKLRHGLILIVGPEGGITSPRVRPLFGGGVRAARVGTAYSPVRDGHDRGAGGSQRRARDADSTRDADSRRLMTRDDAHSAYDSSCIFCRIGKGEIPADVVAEGEEWLAFRDLDPQAPTHLLVIPKRHVVNVDALPPEDMLLGSALLRGCAEAAAACDLGRGYRVVTNVGREGGQEVMHLHLHVLGGRRLGWPPG